MAELELSIAYRSLPARVGLYTMMALMPFWAIIIPFCLGLFLALLLTTPVAFNTAACILVLLVLLPVACLGLSAYFEDDRILVSKEGINFPLLMRRNMRYKHEHSWRDVCDAQITEKRNKKSLRLAFKSGSIAVINLSIVAKSDQEQLLLALEIWGKNCHRSPELIEYQNHLQNEHQGITQFSYTQMWEEELGRRFSASSFVPLEPDKSLQEGRYKIVRQLAFGGLSAIYLAQHREKELVVLKEAVVPASAQAEAQTKASELFEREAMLLMRLNHPQIARVYDHFCENNRHYLVLDYIHGQDLRQSVKQNGPQPEQLVLSWASQITSIVKYLHTQSPPIIHRDLTADNLVRGDDDRLVLIDFGAANEFVGAATGTLVGKQAYIAPEQLRGKASPQSDIYSIGGMIFFLLTGVDPEPLSQSHPKELCPAVSACLDQLVADCTQLDECDRVPDIEDLSLRLKRIVDSSLNAPFSSQ